MASDVITDVRVCLWMLSSNFAKVVCWDFELTNYSAIARPRRRKWEYNAMVDFGYCPMTFKKKAALIEIVSNYQQAFPVGSLSITFYGS